MKRIFCFAAALALTFGLWGCQVSPRITAASLFDDSSLTLPLRPDFADWDGSSTYFTTAYTLDELRRELEGSQEFLISPAGDHFLLVEQPAEKWVNCYLIAETGSEMAFRFGAPFLMTEAGEVIPVPLHLLDLDPASLAPGAFYELREGEPYPAAAPAEAFSTFYQRLGLFDRTERGQELLLTLKAGIELTGGGVRYAGIPFRLTFSGDLVTFFVGEGA